MIKVDVGRMTEEECFELAQELIANIKEEHQWEILDQLVEENNLDLESAIDHLQMKKGGDPEGRIK